MSGLCFSTNDSCVGCSCNEMVFCMTNGSLSRHCVSLSENHCLLLNCGFCDCEAFCQKFGKQVSFLLGAWCLIMNSSFLILEGIFQKIN